MPTLTTASVLKYRPHQTRREIYDSRAKGLVLIVQPSGAKSWAIRLRRPSGKTAKLSIGGVDITDEAKTADAAVIGGVLTLAQARELAAQIDRQRASGIDVVAEHKANRKRAATDAVDLAAHTFGAAVRKFFIKHRVPAKRGGGIPRRWREDAALLGLEFLPGSDPTTKPEVIPGSLAEVWADKPLAEITSELVDTIIEEAGGNGRSRKLFSVLSVFFGQLPLKFRVNNPTRGVDRPGPPAPRDRILGKDANGNHNDEVEIFWRACDNIGGVYGNLAKLMLLTGVRREEAAGMRLAEIGADGSWRIPATRTKNHRPHSLPLPPLAFEIITRVPEAKKNESGLVFTTNGRTPFSGYSKAKIALDAEMSRIAGEPIAPFTLHDLRRTAASGWAALGVMQPVTERLLNHVSGTFAGVAGIYQQYDYAVEKIVALERWAAHLDGLVSDKPDNIVDLPSRKRARVAEDAGAR
jgi:integrase